MQTKAISIRTLMDDGVKDDTGRILSKKIQSGQASWSVPDSTESSGRLLQSNRTTAMARSYSCGYSDLLCGSSVVIYQSTLPDGSVDEFADISAVTCTSGTINSCSGQRTGSGGSFSVSWSSGNPNIASIYGTSQYHSVTLQGNAPGSSGIGGRLQSSYCSAGGGGTETVEPVPRIYLNGRDISFQTGDILLGAQVPLTASVTMPAGKTYSNPTWIVPDAVVGGYSISQSGASYSPVVKDSTSTTFYWTKLGKQTVTYQISLSYGVTTSVSTDFNVITPNYTATAQVTSPVSILHEIPNPVLELGSSTNGMTFNVSTTGNAASYSWVQLVTGINQQYRCPTGSFKSRSAVLGLDGQYPYSGKFGSLTVNDNPNTSLPSALAEVQVSESFTMYLMYDAGSSLTTSSPTIPVSLGYFNWSWGGDAVQSGSSGSWSLVPGTSSSSVTPFNLGGLLPTWNSTANIGGTATCP